MIIIKLHICASSSTQTTYIDQKKKKTLFQYYVLTFSKFLIILLLLFADYTFAIQCYRCTVGPTNMRENRTQQLCAKFSESKEFITDCPYSTMCMKKIFKYELLDGKVVETVTRNCADQRYTEQVINLKCI